MPAVWEDQLNLADPATLAKMADDSGLPGKQLVERSGSDEISAVYEQNRQDALAADVFGSPVYVLDGEVFWGQDRIELLADALKSGRVPYRSQVQGIVQVVSVLRRSNPMMTATSPSKFFHRYRGRRGVGLPWRHRRRRGASMPDTENGRYALSPVTDGVIRLDTRTGAVSTCTNSGNGWACYAVPDERAALDAEIGRLRPTMKSSRANWRRANRRSPARSTNRCRSRTR